MLSTGFIGGNIFAALDGIPEMHRNIFRGRNLGESTLMSDEHKAAIADGSFRDLWVGDYWTHDGTTYRIWDANYFYNCGNVVFTTNHLVIGPDTGLYQAQMNSSNTTDGGYVGSEMRTKNLDKAKEMAEAAFPGMVLTHRDYLVNKVTDGLPSAADWVDSIVEIPNEIMLYGCPIFSPAGTGKNLPVLQTSGNSQFSIFRLNPKMIKLRITHWLRDVVSEERFASYHGDGPAANDAASTSRYVRPYFCIGVK